MTIRRRRPFSCLLGLAVFFAGCVRNEEAAAPLQAVRARPLTDVRFERTPERVERGRYLATAAVACVICHSERDLRLPGAPPVPGREFAGAVMAEEPGYRLVAPNLTPDVATGAGSWSDDMLARAIREGVGHDGRGLGGQMWWWAFRALSDEDLASIIVYLRSLPPVANSLPPRLLSPELEKGRAEGARPLDGPVAARDLTDPVERGRYLIEIADCLGCHSAWEAPIQPGLGGGGNAVERFGEKIWSANLTPDPTGIGPHTEGIFRGALRSGRGGTLHGAMPWVAYRNLSDADIGAIYLALRELPPVAHRVASSASGAKPTACPVCGQEHGFGELNVPPVYTRAPVDLRSLADAVGTYRFGVDFMAVTARFTCRTTAGPRSRPFRWRVDSSAGSDWSRRSASSVTRPARSSHSSPTTSARRAGSAGRPALPSDGGGGTPALGIQSGLLFEAWSPTLDPEHQSAPGGRTGTHCGRTRLCVPGFSKSERDGQFAQQVAKASLSVSAAAGGPWVFE